MHNTEIKNAEIIFSQESKDFDTRKGLNRAVKTTFSESFIDNLLSDGLTVEELDKIKTPIFKYRGQITIHGIFDTETTVRVGGYANVIINGNKSIGIKYNAIDYAKKKRIESILRTLDSEIRYYRNSNTEYFSLQSKDLEPIKELYNLVDTSLFVGTKEAVKYNVWGTWFYACKINVNAIYEGNIWNFITNLTGKTESDYETAKVIKEAEQVAKDLAWKERIRLEKIESANKLEASKEKLTTLNLEIWNNKFINGIVLLRANSSDYEPFTYIELSKKGMWHTIRKVGTKELETPKFDTYNVSKKGYKTEAELMRIFKASVYYVVK